MPSRTGAHWLVGTGSVKPRLACCPSPTRVGSTEVFLLKRAAADERIPGVAARTGTHGLMVGGLTGGSLPADIWVWIVTGVPALELDTGLVGGTVGVSGALGVAPGEGVPEEIRGAGALGSVVDGLAIRVLPTHPGSTGSDTAVGLSVTLLGLATNTVRVTFMTTSLQRVPYVGWLAAADRPVVLAHLAVSVWTTRGTDLGAGEAAAGAEGISCGSSRAPADSHMVLNTAVGSLSTGDGTGVHTLVVLASSLWSAV